MSVVTFDAGGASKEHMRRCNEETYHEVVAYDAWAAARRLRDFLADEDPSREERIAIRDLLDEMLSTARDAVENNEAALETATA
jgi:hypothetical protein